MADWRSKPSAEDVAAFVDVDGPEVDGDIDDNDEEEVAVGNRICVAAPSRIRAEDKAQTAMTAAKKGRSVRYKPE
jgi:hypothetical protein